MWISTRGRYALRVMVDLAENNNGEYIPLKDIAKRQEISEKYLESIMVTMSKAGIIKGLRGKGGGYGRQLGCAGALQRPPERRSRREQHRNLFRRALRQ